jgi:hypothetical protein
MANKHEKMYKDEEGARLCCLSESLEPRHQSSKQQFARRACRFALCIVSVLVVYLLCKIGVTFKNNFSTSFNGARPVLNFRCEKDGADRDCSKWKFKLLQIADIHLG